MMKAIVNASIVLENSILTGYAILYTDKIVDIVPEQDIAGHSDLECLDGAGRYVSAGFIDTHVHGCAGVDTMDEQEDSINHISRHIVQTGVTAFLPTTMTMSLDRITQTLGRIRQFMKDGLVDGAQVLGCHLEGPFINRVYKGAQAEEYILQPDFSLIEPFGDIIKIVTMAPELAGSEDFIRQCGRRDIVVSVGHSAATYEETTAAIAAGASHVTHICNAMPLLNHRQPGILGAAFEHKEVTCELIADNIHVHPAMQRLVLAVKGNHAVLLITDAMRACLLGEGEYDLGGQNVIVKQGEARLASGVIAGSTLTLNRAVYNFMRNTNLSIAEAVALVTSNPARKIGAFRQKGSIAIGKDADFTLFNQEFDVFGTVVRGNLVYRR